MREIASFMVADPHDVGKIKTFTRFLKGSIARNELGDPIVKQWSSVVNEYVLRISRLGEQDLPQHEWRQLGDILYNLEQNRYHGMLDCAGYCFYRAKEYEHAVNCWEKYGVPQKREYYLAKAELCRFPGGLEWLERAKDYKRIIAEWEKAGGLEKAAAERWLKFVGPTFEKKAQHWEAVPVYMQLGNIAKVLDCFDKGSKKVTTLDLQKELVHLVEYLTGKNCWIEAFNVLDKYETAGRGTNRAKLRYYVIRQLAHSDLTPESIPRSQRQLYERFIGRVLEVNDWQEHLSPQEVGTVLERIGSFNKTGEFYSRFLNNSKLQQFARERWILNMKRYGNYLKEQDQNEPSEQIRIELSNRAHDWGIRLDRLDDLPHYPIAKPEKEKELTKQRKKFQIGHIEVVLLRNEKLVLLIDTYNLTAVRVDLKEGKVTGQEVKFTTRRSGEISFDVPQSSYRGTAVYGVERPSIKLEVQGVAGIYSIKF